MLCLQNVADDDGGAEASLEAKGQEERPLQRQQHRPIASASSEDGLQMEVEEEGEEEKEEESRQMIGKDGD